MFKKYNIFIIVGIIFTLVLGTLLHFCYEWSGSNFIVGLFSPINESVWEHLKLLYFPMTLWLIFGYFKYGRKNCTYFISALIGFLCGAVSIPILFYSYTFFTQQNFLAVDIIIFIIGTCISFLIMSYIFKNYNFRCRSVKLIILMWELIFVLFVFFTIFPPDFILFQN